MSTTADEVPTEEHVENNTQEKGVDDEVYPELMLQLPWKQAG